MEPYLTLIVGALIGVLGFFASTFWIQPIIRYREVKSKIIGWMIYLSDVYEDESDDYLKEISSKNPEVQEVLNYAKERMNEKRLECRRLSGKLKGAIIYLPAWYKFFFLKRRRENPNRAKDELIGLANSCDYENTQRCILNIQISLRVPNWKELRTQYPQSPI